MKIYNHIKTVLEQNEKFCKNGKLFKNVIVEAGLKVDPELLSILLSDDTAKKYFFTDVNSVAVFDKVKFQKFVSNKQFLPDSYTAFKNKIGLTANGEYLTEANEVVLDFPYKDCVLEGGQTKDNQKRQEIFWNETLAPDEIDRLFEPKVLTNWKRYDKNGAHKVKNISIDDNLIIKGNNLIALHSLKKVYKGKVKLIYIDPPYNTGNDSFQYNDSFNHSTWLTFMKNRLEVAKELLREDGVIFVQCDDNEQAYLKVLMDNVFGRENFVNDFVRKTGIAARIDAKYISKEHDYILCFAKNINRLKINKESVSNLNTYNLKDKYFEKRGKYKLNKLDRGSISYSKSLDYSIKSPDGSLIYPGGIKDYNGWCWRWSKEKFEWGIKNGFIEFKKNSGWSVYFKQYQFVDNQNKPISRENPYKSLMVEDFNNELGTSEMTKMFGNKIFIYPKPEALLQRIIEISTQKGDIVLDYHLGSGTTAAVAHKMGRRYIGIEQMDYIEDIAVERLKKVMEGEQGGISKAVAWQGGGSFIYTELAKDNAAIVEPIQNAKNSEEVIAIWEAIKDKSFISYKVHPKDIDKNISDFKALSLDAQKKFLLSLLDKNQLYVNHSEVADKDHSISSEDKDLNQEFYSLKGLFV